MNAASPDEQAIVERVKELGYSFEGKDGDNIITIKRTKDSSIHKVKLLHTLEFSSDRKRMSVIV